MSDEEQKFGLEGIEHDQGFERMPMSSPVDTPEPDQMSESELAHARRPVEADWGPEPVERDYKDVNTGAELDPKLTVDARQAAHDVNLARESERAAREQRDADDLRFALDQLPQDGQPPQQPAQDQQPQPVDGVQPEQIDPAQAQADPWAEADAQITEMLSNPVVRERIQGELTEIQTKAKAEVDGAWQQVEQAKTAYLQHANVLTGQLNALLLSNFPELQSVAGDPQRLAGAVQMLAQTNPQRAQALADFAMRASTVAGQLEQQGQAHRQAAQQQSAETFARYAAEQDSRAFSKTAPEELTRIRNFLYADAEKAGISRAELEKTWNSVPALRNAFTSELVADGVRWRMAQRGLAQQRHNPIPQVQRPGANVEPRGDNDSYSSLEREFRGKSLNPKQAADLLIAHRARR